MAYDEELAYRIRELLSAESGVHEQPMFGGLSFLLNGNMAVAISSKGGILVRVDPAEADDLVAATKAEPAVMGGRTMQGWLHVTPEHLKTKRQLGIWIQRGSNYAHSLPPKRPRR